MEAQAVKGGGSAKKAPGWKKAQAARRVRARPKRGVAKNYEDTWTEDSSLDSETDDIASTTSRVVTGSSSDSSVVFRPSRKKGRL
jgi:hypothetical protein